MDLPGGTDVAHAKLHPRLDHWYRGEATAPESKKGSTSPKRRRTSESSGSLLLTSSTISSSTRPQRPAKKAPIPRATRTSQRNVGATAVSQVADSPATSYAITFSSEGGCFPSRHTRAQSPAQARDAGRSSSPKASAHVQAAPKIPLSDLLNDPGTPNK